MIVDALIERIKEYKNPTVAGLDTSFEYLPEEMKRGVQDFKGVADAVLCFNKEIVDKICDIVPCVKVQIAYYEM